MGRSKKAWICKHHNRIHYAKGVCQDCYIVIYNKVLKFLMKKKYGNKKCESNIKDEFDLSQFF